MKKVLCLIIILCTFTSSIVYFSANSKTELISYATVNNEKPISVMVDGEELKFHVEPVIYHNRILVPLRAIFEALGAKVTWHNEEKKITAQKDDLFITLMVNSYVITINDEGYDRNSGISVKIYFDEHNNSLCHGVLILLGGHLNRIDMTSPEFLRVQSLENFDTTNAFLVNSGIKPLLWKEYAAEAAKRHSRDMADNDYFSHESQDGRGMKERYMSLNKVDWRNLGENISAGRFYGIDAFNGWINSIGHRENMLNKDFNF